MVIVVIVLLLCYIFQPSQKGKGYNTFIKYELVNNWPDLPGNLKLGNPTGIALDSSENILIFHRADRKWPLLGAMPENPIAGKTLLVIDKDNGKLIDSWGDHLFIMPHGLKADSENNIWVTDVGLHQVFKFNNKGKLLLKLGEAGVAGNDSLHFNKPTDIAIAKNGSFYVSDGYGNSRIIKFSATGKYLLEWGTKGSKEGQFNIPHGITIDNQGYLYVADRENNRIQVFDTAGKYIKQITDPSFGAISAVTLKNNKLYAVDDYRFLKMIHKGSDIIGFDTAGKTPVRFGRSGSYEGSTCWYHTLAVDNDENIYVGDILKNRLQKFKKVIGQ